MRATLPLHRRPPNHKFSPDLSLHHPCHHRSSPPATKKPTIPLASITPSSYLLAIDKNTVTVSPKYQIVIPLAIREELKLRPGEKLRVLRFQDRVELIPVRPLKSLRGFLKGIDTSIVREEDRL